MKRAAGRPPKKVQTIVKETRQTKSEVKNNTLTMTRAKRTPKPNPKYMDEIMRKQSRSNSPNTESGKKVYRKDDSDSDSDLRVKVLTKKRLFNNRDSSSSSTPPAKKINYETKTNKNLGEMSKSVTTVNKKPKLSEILTSKLSEEKRNTRKQLKSDEDSDYEMVFSSNDEDRYDTEFEEEDDSDDDDFKLVQSRTRPPRKSNEATTPKTSPGNLNKSKIQNIKTSTPLVSKTSPILTNKLRQAILSARNSSVAAMMRPRQIEQTPRPQQQLLRQQQPRSQPQPSKEQPHSPKEQPQPSREQPQPPREQPQPPRQQPPQPRQQPPPPRQQPPPPRQQPPPPRQQPPPPRQQPLPPRQQIPPPRQQLPPARQPPQLPRAQQKSTSPKLKLSTPCKGTDFEADVPTFTIVNINDIMKKAPERPLKKKYNFNRILENDEADTIDLSIDRSPPSKKFKDDSNEISKTNSRRKTQHTTILTDDFEAKIKSNSLSKVPTPQPQTQVNNKSIVTTKPTGNNITFNNNNNNITKTLAPSSAANNSKLKHNFLNDSKPAPRILNTMLARKKLQQTPLIAEFDLTQDEQLSPVKSVKTIKQAPIAIHNKSVSKENLKTYSNPNFTNSMKTLNNKSSLQTLMGSKPKVVIGNEGGRRVKKITCFETWYVINIPNVEVPIQKPQVIVDLITLGNEIKSIDLPTEWNYRITLSKLSNSSKGEKRPENEKNVYTGEIHEDVNIAHEEKQNYEPTTIVFRRNNTNKTLKMQYDRSIIFKNRSYYLNVDGKTVRLLGAPQFINTLKEIETLIQIIDDISLINPYIEPTSIVL